MGTLRELFARAAGRCEVCGRCGPFLHVHHRVPWSRGGTHEPDCLELRCSACHALGHEPDYRSNPDWERARSSARRKRAAREAGG